MATKTFEELKQMAIQIRDEKTNKQNTATRIGTQMLEHLNKLEQDFLDKDTTEAKYSELEQKIPSNYIQTAPDIKNLISNVGWLTSNNTVYDDSSWRYGYVEVPFGATSVYLSNYDENVQSAPAILFLDDNDLVIEYVSYSSKSCISNNIPSSCKKIGFSIKLRYIDLFRFEFRTDYAIKKDVDKEIEFITAPIFIHGYIDTSGKLKNYGEDVQEDYVRTNYLYIKGAELIEIIGAWINKYVSAYTFYDKDKKAIELHVGPSSSGSIVNATIQNSNFPKEACYITITSKKSITNKEIKIKLSSQESAAAIYNELNNDIQNVKELAVQSVAPYVLQIASDIKEQITDTGWVQSTGEINLDGSWVNGKVEIPVGCKSLELDKWDSVPNAAVNIILLNNSDDIVGNIPMSIMPISINIPKTATKIHLSVRKTYIKSFKALFLGYISNAILQDDVAGLKKDVSVISYKNYSENSLKRLNGYAYINTKTFLTNEYTDDYWYSLYKLSANVNYCLEQKQGLESAGILAGFIGSEEDFVLGGKIKSIVMSGNGSNPLQNIEIESSGVERLLVVLGTTLDEYSRVQLKQEESIAKVKDKIKELENNIANINNKEQICCPDKFYAVVGQEFNLYYNGVIKGLDAGLQSPLGTYVDIQCPDLQNGATKIGVRKERMWQIDGLLLTNSYVGNHDMWISAWNDNGELIDRKQVTLTVSYNTPLTEVKRILCIGDSLTINGPIVATCGQHFEDLGGTQPEFIGQRTTSGYKHEGYPGYTFGSFVTNAINYAYTIFDVPQGTNVSVGDKYKTNETTFTVMDIRTEGLDNALRLRCESVSGTPVPPSTGTLTKISGQDSSDSSISYTAVEKESGNPFWDINSGTVSFTKYREKMGMGSNKFDLVIIMLGTNDCIGNIKSSMQNSLNNAISLINYILSDAGDYPTKIILQMTPPDANTISSWQVYGDSSGDVSGKKMGYWTNLWNLRKLLYSEFTKEEWKDKVFLGQAALGIDRYYGYPYTEVASSSRISTIKEIYHTNSVHPDNEGYQQLGDGYYLQAKGLLES